MFNNKFSTGILKHPGYNIDGGFGEAALMGALIGGGTSLLTGKNPLSGALLGGLTGGAVQGISGAFGAGTAAGATDQVLANSALENGATSFLDSAGNLTPALNTTVADAGSVLSSSPDIVSSAMNGADAYGSSLANSGMTQAANGTYFDPQYLADNPAIQQSANQAINQGAQQAANQGIAGVAKSKGFLGPMKDWWGGLEPWEKAGVGIAGGVGLHYLTQPPELVDPNIGKNNYKGPKLHDLSPDFRATETTPNVYYPHYAEGGIAGLANGGMGTQGMGDNQNYPGGRLDTTQFATPSQMPTSTPVIDAGYEQKTNAYTGEPTGYAQGGVTRMATGGMPGDMKYFVGSNGVGMNEPSSLMPGDMKYFVGSNQNSSMPPAPNGFIGNLINAVNSLPAPAPTIPTGIASNYNASTPTQQAYQPDYGMLNTGSGNAGGVSALPSGYQGLQKIMGMLHGNAGAPQTGVQTVSNPQAPVKKMAAGGDTGSAVYYDPAKGQYFTQAGAQQGYNGVMGGWFNQLPMGQLFSQIPGFAQMSNDPNSPFWDGRTYLGTSMPGSRSTSGVSDNYNASVTAPEVYHAQFNGESAGQPVPPAASGYRGVDYNPATAPAPQVAQAAVQAIGNPQAAMLKHYARGGGIGDLGGYAAGGNPRLLNGPGDGMSDSIPATIGGRQPARLADGEFVVPADVVSHLGNGSTDAGAKHLYAMMDKVRRARTGNVKQGKQINPNKFLPA